MSLTKSLETLPERVRALEVSISYLNVNIHGLRKSFYAKKATPLWLRVGIIINTGITGWLSVLTYIVVQKL